MKKQITIFADEGMILTDGINYATTFSLEADKGDEKYYEITREEYEEIMLKEEQEAGGV